MSGFIEALRLERTMERKPVMPRRLLVDTKIIPPCFDTNWLRVYEGKVLWKARIACDEGDEALLLRELSNRLRWDIYKDLYELLMDLNEAAYGGDTDRVISIIKEIKKEVGL